MFRIIGVLINIVLGIVEILLVLRLIFEALAARLAPLVVWLYGVTAPLVAPFVGIFPNWRFGSSVIDAAALVALIVYALVGYFLLWIF